MARSTRDHEHHPDSWLRRSITNFIAIKRDVTERKAAAEEADRERSLLRALIDNLPDLIYVKDSENRFLVAKDGTARLMSAAGPEELPGKTDFDFYPERMADPQGGRPIARGCRLRRHYRTRHGGICPPGIQSEGGGRPQ